MLLLKNMNNIYNKSKNKMFMIVGIFNNHSTHLHGTLHATHCS